MATTVTLPALGESVTEGTVTQWLKQVGDEVAVDEPLLEVSTDKVDTEIPSPVAGTLLEIKADEDETVEVGAVLAIIGEAGESADSGSGDDSAPVEDTAEAQPEPEPAPEPESAPEPEQKAEPEQSAPPEDTPSGPDTRETDQGTEIVLPALGESVTEGTVTQWLKQVGDDVAVDEPLLEISTDKVDTEVPSPVAGKLLEIRAEEDETVEVGAVLAVIGSGDAAPQQESQPAAEEKPEPEPEPEPAPEPEPEPKAEEAPAPEPEPEPEPGPQKAPEPAPAPQASTSSSSSGDTYVTPIVRKLAKQHGVDLASITGTGVGGRIRKQDVLDAAEKAPAAAAPAAAATSAPAAPAQPSPLRGSTEKLSRLRKTIATRMVESLQVSAQLTQVHEVDVTEIARLRARHKDAFLEREGVKLTYLPFFAKAAIEALKSHPKVNAALDVEAGTVTYPDGEHLGIAVDTERGLLVPTIRDAGDLSIAGLARKIADVAERTRTNKISPDEISGATFTITNLGSNGALFDTPIINQPQVAILGVGAVVKRPVVITDAQGGESIAVRSMAYLALTYDHRIIDGADAGRFLTAVKDRLQNGSFDGEMGS
ncbi:2-oxoglutarate dehydrogenase, E2 component, dihydrolipoamide succinyltransferase [Aeromicrobium terrae]|uniref:Dihydrolipoamide acetyltransferase component of pyruvate dehydrogenase complex n=1 Tax=Aeromicrobium terrae TaxID=2498846 RepID=A0A5C8NPF1_9ACTN|nr:2-oxoglutarate dehydrogenase, E2 component, dihydrolipoamide succinyltransferase [Aeromicrobium terrae]TXL62785.1 2-oxoglutarate dehydrogenase, E2 component, dihydrolipoamide succinyltransferase [Aeromicrobium terrae]